MKSFQANRHNFWNNFELGVPPKIALYINDERVYTTDNCGWLFDYESGILTFLNTPSGDSSRIVRIEAFQYIGPTLSNGMTGIEYDSIFGHLTVQIPDL